MAALLAMASCSQNEETEGTPVPLTFSTPVETQTRADITTATLTDMGVLACFTQGAGFDPGTSTPNFLYNERVYKDGGGVWQYDNTRYWPVNPADKVSFFAYAPYNTPGVALSPANQAGYPQITYTTPATGDGADLLASVPLMNKNGGTIGFTMKHALTKVTLVLRNGDTGSQGKLFKSITINSKSKGVLTFDKGGFTWGSFSGIGEILFPLPSGSVQWVLPTEKDATRTIGTLYLLPDNTGCSFPLKYEVYGNMPAGGLIPSNEITADVPIPPSPAWEPGGSVTYTITVTKEGIKTITGAVGTNWVQASESTGEFTPYYNGKKPNLLAIPGKTPYWVAPEDAAIGITRPELYRNINSICPPGWYVPSLFDLEDMGLQHTASPQWDSGGYVHSVFSAEFYWTTTDWFYPQGTSVLQYTLDVRQESFYHLTTEAVENVEVVPKLNVRCVMKK